MNIFNVSFKKELERLIELELEKFVHEHLGGEMMPILANGEPAFCEEELIDSPGSSLMAVFLPSGEVVIVEANALAYASGTTHRASS